MDYVVFGLGFGATLLVLGLVIRDVGPRVRYRRPGGPDGVFHAEELVARVSWERFCGALGTILAIGGLTFVIVTAICMALRLTDRAAGWVMLGSLALLCMLMTIWTWAFFDRFGSYGILPERGEHAMAKSAPASDHQGATGTADGGIPASAVEADSAAVAEGSTRQASDDHTRVDTPAMPASPDEAQSPLLKTPEELVAASNDVDHESLEAELDIPVDVHGRPFRHGAELQDDAASTASQDEPPDGPDDDTSDKTEQKEHETSS